MVRYALVPLVLLLVGVSPAVGQDWARKMFKVTSHDFGRYGSAYRLATI